MIHLLLLTYLLHFVSSQNVPSFVDVKPVLIHNVNDTAALSCKVKNLRQGNISWGKQKNSGTTSLSLNGMKAVLDERFHLNFDNTSAIPSSTLTIDKIQPKDAAVYRCSINLPDGDEIIQDVTLQVRSPPYFVGNTSTKVTTSLNGSITLECYGGGYPAPNVTWTRENKALLPNGQQSFRGEVLKINNVQKEHAGDYLCTMDNEVTSIKKLYQLMVEYAPIVTPRHERVGQAVGHETYLECLIESFIAPDILWRKDNIPINQDNQVYTRSQNAINDPLRSAVLKIKIDGKQYGTYTCEASNKAGKGSAAIQLYQTDKEVCVQNCNTSSGHSIISVLDLKLSFTSVIVLMFHWQNM